MENQVEDDVKVNNRHSLVLKLDSEKVYDWASWGHLDKVLEKKGFCSKWRRWVKGYFSTSTFAVIINGEPKAWFRN